jgi:hypothetical protein
MHDGQTLLAWTPVVHAAGYVVLRGPTHDQLEVIARTSATIYVDSDVPDVGSVIYAVAAFASGGEHGDAAPISTDTSGDCVAWSTSLQVSVSLGSCVDFGS